MMKINPKWRTPFLHLFRGGSLVIISYLKYRYYPFCDVFLTLPIVFQLIHTKINYLLIDSRRI